MVALAFGMQAAYANHPGGGHIKIVLTSDPSQDLSVNPLVLWVGDSVSLDFMVELPSTEDSIYATEFHTRRAGFRNTLRSLDAEPETPGLQFAVSGDRLALTGKERLNTVIVGFPDDGDLVRPCTFDPTPQPGDDSIYDFIKGAIGGNTSVPLQLLDQHQRPEWGPNWCGPTAAGISLAWFAETASGDTANHSALIPHSGDITTADKFEAINTFGHDDADQRRRHHRQQSS